MILIQKGLSPELIRPAAVLFTSAFAEKLNVILGKEDQAIEFIESSIVADNCLAAVDDNRLLGFLAILTREQSFLELEFKSLRAQFGFLGGILRAIALSLIQHRPKPGELYIDELAVAESARGMGVGTKLLEEILIFCRANGYGKLTLHVIDTNPRAQQLYERFGFKAEKYVNVWPLNRILGWNFNKAIFMSREVN